MWMQRPIPTLPLIPTFHINKYIDGEFCSLQALLQVSAHSVLTMSQAQYCPHLMEGEAEAQRESLIYFGSDN